MSGVGFVPASFLLRGISRVVCRFGASFDPNFAPLVTAHTVSDTQALCFTPMTVVGDHVSGWEGDLNVSLSLAGGAP